jgi:hypothetical protein
MFALFCAALFCIGGDLAAVQFPVKGVLLMSEGFIVSEKGKAVPLHAMKTPGGRGGIAPTHSQPRH